MRSKIDAEVMSQADTRCPRQRPNRNPTTARSRSFVRTTVALGERDTNPVLPKAGFFGSPLQVPPEIGPVAVPDLTLSAGPRLSTRRPALALLGRGMPSELQVPMVSAGGAGPEAIDDFQQIPQIPMMQAARPPATCLFNLILRVMFH